jgi:DNA modification methylase
MSNNNPAAGATPEKGGADGPLSDGKSRTRAPKIARKIASRKPDQYDPRVQHQHEQLHLRRESFLVLNEREVNQYAATLSSTSPSALITGDSRKVLAGLPERSVQMCVTSPPYWSLRNYHIDGQIGLESSLKSYIDSLVDVFSELRRVMRDDGTLWLNIGDSYTSGGRTWRAPDKKNPVRAMDIRPPTPEGLKSKDLIGVPWRLALALQDAGWFLRADIIWNKPNCYPESVKDRPTKAHEYVFLLARSRRYYYDAKAIATAAVKSASRNKRRRYGDDRSRSGDHLGASVPWEGDTANARDVWVIDHDDAVDRVPGHHALMPVELARRCVLAGSRPGDLVLDPFSGMASTGLAAVGAGRPYTGIELNPAYLATSAERLRSLDPTAPLRPSATAHWSLFERT